MKSVWLTLLMATVPAFASVPLPQHYTAYAEGSLTIGADGRVLDVELTSPADLGEGVLAGYEERISSWRFEPIVEGGKPMNVKGLMQLSLVAIRGNRLQGNTFGITDVQFLDPPGSESAGKWSRLTPPPYPKDALAGGAGADVMLFLKLDPQGQVLAAAVERIALLGVTTDQGRLGNLEAQFRRSAERVAKQWNFGGLQGEAVVRVPVRYLPPHYADGWLPTVFRPVAPPEWVLVEQAAGQTVGLNAGGVALSTQIKLLTPLDGA